MILIKIFSLSILSLLISTNLFSMPKEIDSKTKYCSAPTEECFNHHPMLGYNIINEEAGFKKTALLIHGLSDSPYYMKDIAKILFNQGHSIVAIQLSGHGTKPEDLEDVKASDWINDLERGLHLAKQFGEEITIAGFSTGGSIASYALSQSKDKYSQFNIKKALLFSPALQLLDPSVDYACYARYLPITIGKKTHGEKVRYQEYPLNGPCQLHKYLNGTILRDSIKGLKQKKLSIPTLSIFAGADDAVDILGTDAKLKSFLNSYSSIMIGQNFPDSFKNNFFNPNEYSEYQDRRANYKPDLQILSESKIEHSSIMLREQGLGGAKEVNPAFDQMKRIIVDFMNH